MGDQRKEETTYFLPGQIILRCDVITTRFCSRKAPDRTGKCGVGTVVDNSPFCDSAYDHLLSIASNKPAGTRLTIDRSEDGTVLSLAEKLPSGHELVVAEVMSGMRVTPGTRTTKS